MNSRPRSVTGALGACLLVLLPGACATRQPPVADGGGTVCADPRPEVCTMEYDPVCANLSDATHATYPNACGACADAAVVSHRPGACE